jgi:parallel beta-helix repeat protein
MQRQWSPRGLIGAAVLLLLLWGGHNAMATTADWGKPSRSSGTVYYVAPTGSDWNPGTEDKPWQTIQKAADTLVTGDTVYVKAGTYHERVQPQNSGSADNYITYAAYPGDTVTIDGTGVNVPDWGGLFDITDRSYIRVSGLRIMNAGPGPHNPGILVDLSSYVIIENNYVYNSSDSGIGVWDSEQVIVDRNEVVAACYDGYNESISIGGTDGFEVRYNHVHDGQKEGIDAKDGSRNGEVYGNHVHDMDAVGIYVDAWDKHTYSIEIFGNVVYDIADNDGFAVASETGGVLEDIRIYNNVAHHNRYCGLSITANGPGGPGGERPMNGIHVVNNTFYDNGWETWGGGIAVDNPDAQSVVIRNNICSQNLYFQIAVGPSVPAQNITIDHNLIRV